MDICYSSRCKFLCPKAGFSTTNINTAIEWSNMGFDVLFYYNGKYVGELIYGGEIDRVSNIPLDVNCGTTFFCRETNSFIPIMQEEIINSRPLIRVREVTYSEFFIQ